MRWSLGLTVVTMVAAFATAFVGSGGATVGVETGRLTATVAGQAIAIARGDGSGRRVLARGGESFISPDGARVAVTDYDEGAAGATKWRIGLYSAAGGSPTRSSRFAVAPTGHQTPRGSPASTPTSPTSRRACCSSTPQVALCRRWREGLFLFDTQVSFSPDSRSLAYVQQAKTFAPSGTLKIIDLATRAISTVRGGAAAPAWGPNAIALSTVKPRGKGYPVQQVALIQRDGSDFRQLSNIRPNFLQGGLVPIAWSADGSRLLAGQGGQDTWQAYAVDPIRGGAREVAVNMTPSALTPDGRFIIGDSTGGEDYGPDRANVVRVPWAGGKAKVLLRNAVAPSYAANAKPVKLPPISGRCSKATALKVATQFQLGVDAALPKPIAQVLCGAFAGPGSKAMAASIAIPSCGRTAQWAVFRWTRTAWQLVLTRNNGADLDAVGSDIRETQFVLRPGDAHCFPTGGTRSRVWHWDDKRFTASAWKLKPSAPAAPAAPATTEYFKTPSRNIQCVGSTKGRAFVQCGIKSGLQPAPPRRPCQ